MLLDNIADPIVIKNQPFANQEVEKAILADFLDPMGASDKTLKYIRSIKEEDFSNAERAAVFRAIKELYLEKQNIDLLTVDKRLTETYRGDAQRYTAAMLDASLCLMLPQHMQRYVDILLECSARRRILGLAYTLYTEIADPANTPSNVLSNARQAMKDIQAGTHKWESMADVLMATFDNLEKRMKGEMQSIATGVGNLDKIIGGIFPGELTVVGARPGVGKSAFAANLAITAAKQGKRVGIVSREMTNIQYGQRVLSREASVDGMRIRQAALDEDDLAAIVRCMGEASILPIDFLFSVSSVEQLRVEVEKHIDGTGLDMLIVDYLQLMRSDKKHEADRLRVAHISHMLKDMTVDLKIPVIALAQVGRIDEMPTLANLRDSGDIEQDADGVIFLYAPQSAADRYVSQQHKEAFPDILRSGMQYITVNAAKQRQGQTGFVNVLFDPAKMRYTEIDLTHSE